MPETKKSLKEFFIETGEAPSEKVMQMQRNIFKEMNYNIDYACSQMDLIPKKYLTDQELISKMQQFQIAAELAVKYYNFYHFINI